MARPRTPTKVLELRGAFKKDPQRKRPNEPEVDTKTVNKKPPSRLTADQKKTWREIVKVIPAGVLSTADLVQVEIVVCLLTEFRQAGGAMSTSRIGRLTSEMGKLGLNPSARASLTVEKPKGNKFND